MLGVEKVDGQGGGVRGGCGGCAPRLAAVRVGGTCRRGNDCLAGRTFYFRFLETEGSSLRATQGRPRANQEAEGVKGNGGKSLHVDSVGRGGRLRLGWCEWLPQALG